MPVLALASFGTAIGCGIWQLGERSNLISGAMRLDELTIVLTFIFCAGRHGDRPAVVAQRRGSRGVARRVLRAAADLGGGMFVFVAAQNLVALFLGLELLSIPLYVLCATEMRRSTSLESGLKYLIIGSVGSATLLYGLAFIYGATGSTDYAGIAAKVGGVASDPLFLTGIALALAGMSFKASVAPFHQWTPDVYEGAPTPVTAFMAVATKAAALGAMLRFFDVALLDAQSDWGPAIAALATITIVVGNVGALGQSSLKRLMAWSSVAQAGYMLAGVVVATRLGVQATVFYLATYLFMNMAAFARDRRARAVDPVRRRHPLGRGPRGRAAAAGGGDDARDARPGGHPGDRRVHREVLSHRCRRGGRLHVARHRDRDRVDGVARLLPAGRSRRCGCSRPSRPTPCRSRRRPAARRSPAATRSPTPPRAAARGVVRRARCSGPRRCSSASSRRRCSTWPCAPGRRSPGICFSLGRGTARADRRACLAARLRMAASPRHARVRRRPPAAVAGGACSRSVVLAAVGAAVAAWPAAGTRSRESGRRAASTGGEGGPRRRAEPLPLTRAVGRKIMTAMRGPFPSRSLRARVRRGQVGGVILFGPNVGPRLRAAIARCRPRPGRAATRRC